MLDFLFWSSFSRICEGGRWHDRFKPAALPAFLLPAHLASVLAFFQKRCLFWPKTGCGSFIRTHAVFRILSPQKPRNTAQHRPNPADKMTRFALLLSCLPRAVQNSKCGRRLISAREFESLHLRHKKHRNYVGFGAFFLFLTLTLTLTRNKRALRSNIFLKHLSM